MVVHLRTASRFSKSKVAVIMCLCSAVNLGCLGTVDEMQDAGRDAGGRVDAGNRNDGGTDAGQLVQPPTVLQYSSNPASYPINQPIAANSPTSAGGAVDSYTVTGTLPAGLTLNSSTGVITGTPTTPGELTCVVTAANSAGSTSVTLTITIIDVAPSALTYSPNSLEASVGHVFTSASPSNAGGTITQFDSSPPLPSGLTLSATGAIVGTPTTRTPQATYTITASNNGGSTSTTITLRVIAPPDGLNYQPSFAVYTKGVTITPSVPTHTGGSIDNYSVSPTLPAGLTLDPVSGTISGTPSNLMVDAATYVVTATNVDGTATVTLTIRVVDVPPSMLSYSPTNLACHFGLLCQAPAPTAVGGAIVSFSVAPSLPQGMSLDPVTGAISGRPLIAQAAKAHVVMATNSGGNSTTTVTVSISGDVIACEQLQYIPKSSTATYPLVNDIDCAGLSIHPIQDFRGTFDGQHHLIRHLHIDEQSVDDVGLFGSANGATVKDLGVVDALVTARASLRAGIIAGSFGGTMQRVFTTGAVVNSNFGGVSQSGARVNLTGGLAGDLSSPSPQPGALVEDCFSLAVVNGGNDYSGGIIGVVEAGNSHIVRRTYAVPPIINTTLGEAGSNRPASLLTYSWSTVRDSFSVSPGSELAIYGVFGTAQNNVSQVAGTANSAADGGIASFQGPGSSSNAPFASTWDFAGTWQETARYPTLRGFSYPTSFDLTGFGYKPGYQRLVKGAAMTNMVPVSVSGVSSCTVSPALPAGITLDSVTCAISGTPTSEVPSATYVVQGQSPQGTVSAAVQLLTQAPSTLNFGSANLNFDAELGAITPITPAVTLHGDPLVQCIATPSLPTGLSLNQLDCTLSGKPTRTATATYKIFAATVSSLSTTSINLTVVDARPELAYPSGSNTLVTDVALVGIEPTKLVNVVSSSISPALPAGLSFDSATATIQGTPTAISASTEYTVTAFNNVGQSVSAKLTLSVTPVVQPTSFTITQLDTDTAGNVVAVGLSGRNFVVQVFNAAGTSVAGPKLVAQTSRFADVGPTVSRAKGTGAMVVGAGFFSSGASADSRWAIRRLTADGTGVGSTVRLLRTYGVPSSTAIDDSGRVAVAGIESVYHGRLWLFDASNTLVSSVDPGGCATPYSARVALSNSTDFGVYLCEADTSNPVMYRRFTTSTGAWLDAAGVKVSDGAQQYTPTVTIAPSGAFVVWWYDQNNRRDRAAVYSAAGALVGSNAFPVSATTNYNALGRAFTRPQLANGDFIVPYHDDANGGTAYLNSYARITTAAVVLGSASSSGYDLINFAASDTTTWAFTSSGLVRNPFALVP